MTVKNSTKDLWKVINRVIGKTKHRGNVISCIMKRSVLLGMLGHRFLLDTEPDK